MLKGILIEIGNATRVDDQIDRRACLLCLQEPRLFRFCGIEAGRVQNRHRPVLITRVDVEVDILRIASPTVEADHQAPAQEVGHLVLRQELCRLIVDRQVLLVHE